MLDRDPRKAARLAMLVGLLWLTGPGEAAASGSDAGGGWAQDVKDFGLPAVLGAVAGAVLGAQLTARAGRAARLEERRYAEGRKLVEEEREAAGRLDGALADAGHEGTARILSGDARAGFAAAAEKFEPAYYRDRPVLAQDELRARLTAVAVFLNSGRAQLERLPPGEAEAAVDYEAAESLERAIANARTALIAFRRGESTLPRNDFPTAELLVALVDVAADRRPFAGLADWLEANPASDAVAAIMETHRHGSQR